MPEGAPLPHPVKLAWHAPCTLQHGQKITGVVEALLTAAGYDVLIPLESNLCCGSAGTYSLLEPVIATQLRDRELGDLPNECAGASLPQRTSAAWDAFAVCGGDCAGAALDRSCWKVH